MNASSRPAPARARRLLIRAVCALTLLTAAAAPAIAVQPSAAADDPELTVTWPEVTRFNPTVTEYTFDVHDTGSGQLVASWGYYHEENVDPDGPHTMTFPTDDVNHVVLHRCIDDTGCQVVAESPELEVRRRLGVSVDDGPVDIGAQRTPRFDVRVWPAEGAQVTLAWRLTEEDAGPTVANGETVLVPDATGSVQLPVQVPADLRSGRYELVVAASADLPDFGHLDGESIPRPVNVDNDISAPQVRSLPKIFYPYRDHYQDTMTARFTAAEYAPVTVDVLDRAGDRIRRILDTQNVPGDAMTATWNGSDRRGRLVRPGTYTLQFRIQDDAGNTATTDRTVTVSGKRLVLKTWQKTFAAKATLVAKGVGRCSTLASPARPGWTGSLGYHSMTNCRRDKQSMVITHNGVWVPKSPTGRYGDFRVSMDGAGAASSLGSPYIVMGYLRARDGKFAARVEIHGDGVHHGRTSATPYVRDRATRPYLLWSAGLMSGSRYDVRTFTVRLSYYVLG